MTRPTVAVIGASSNRAKYGNKSLRAHVRQGYDVYPINPNEPEVEGLPTFASLKDVPVDLDRITVYVPPAVTLKLLDEIAAKGCDELWLNPGSADDAVAAKAEALGLNPIRACSILDLGVTPAEFPG